MTREYLFSLLQILKHFGDLVFIIALPSITVLGIYLLLGLRGPRLVDPILLRQVEEPTEEEFSNKE